MTFHFTQADRDRFMRYVRILPNGCWEWLGGRSRGKGNKAWYGTFWVAGRSRRAHIAAAVMFGQGHQPGHHEDHLCNWTLCVNPEHVECVPREVNQARKIERRKRHEHEAGGLPPGEASGDRRVAA